MKQQVVFSCEKCDGQFSKWSGQCPQCQSWGTLKQEEHVSSTSRSQKPVKPGKLEVFQDLQSHLTHPQATQLSWFDQLLSGGLVDGSVTLLGGEPGIGKSTITAQLLLSLAQQGQATLYVTGEENPQQVSARLQRLSQPMLPATLSYLDSTDANIIASTIRSAKPFLTVIDSIQTIRANEATGEAGNPTQVKASAAIIHEAAKEVGCRVLLIGQVNKDGDLAGPRLLEHLVDTVIMIEGDRGQSLRLLRVLKHRFGQADESCIIAMTEKGLVPVVDPGAALLSHRPVKIPGTVVTTMIEGNKPLLVEIQVLATPAGYGTPLRRTSGIDSNRASLLLAVLARRAGIGFGDQDVFANIIGGFSANDPGLDIAFCLAALSAKQDIPLDPLLSAIGEVGLAGELRPTTRMDQRIKELVRLGFTRILVPKGIEHKSIKGVTIVPCSSVREAAQQAQLLKVS